MPRVPTESVPQEELKPTPINPKTAATLGGEVVDLAEGIGALGGVLQKAQTMRQKLAASDVVAKQRIQAYKIAATDPNPDTVLERISESYEKTIDQQAGTISDAEESDKWKGEQLLGVDRQMIPLQGIVAKRINQDIKALFNTNIENSIKELANSADKGERQLIKDGMYKLANEVRDPYVHAGWAKERVDTAIRKSEIDQIDKDSAIPGMAEAVAREIQDPNGMYKDLPKPVLDRKFAQVTAMIKNKLQ